MRGPNPREAIPATVLAILTVAFASAPIVAHAQTATGWIGVSVDIATVQRGSASSTTVRIAAVQPGSPAERAGVRAGDTLLAVNDWSGPDDLRSLADRLRLEPGDPVRLVVSRAGRPTEIRVVAGDRPSGLGIAARPAPPSPDSIVTAIERAMDALRQRLASGEGFRVRFERAPQAGDASPPRWVEGSPSVRPLPPGLLPRRADQDRDSALAGLRFLFLEDRAMEEIIRDRGDEPRRAFSPFTPYRLGMNRIAGAEAIDLHPELSSYFEVDAGVLIVDVPDGTPAHAAGLRPGDVVVSAGERPVRTLAGLREAVATQRVDALSLEVVRRGERVRIIIPR